MKNTDLHTHSYYSDGLISPKELVRLAKKRKIKNLALTDHNTVKGVSEAIKEGKKIGVKVIPAVEIRCNTGEMLGYFIDIKNKKLNKELEKIGRRVENQVADWCAKLEKAGYKISFKEIWKKFPKARGNINEFYPLFILHFKGYGSTLELSKKLKKEAKKKNIGKKKIREITTIEAIRLIKKAGGVSVLAHPWIEEKALKEKNFKKYVNAGLKGVEINNGDRPPFKRKGVDKKIRKLAKKYKLILTSGSDFHGLKILKQMPGNHEIGKNNCNEKIVKQLEAIGLKI